MNPDIEKAIAAIRSQGGTDADVEAYLRQVGAVEVTDPATASLRAVQSAGDRSRAAAARDAATVAERRMTGMDRLGANLQTATDMATFGVSGLVDDAISAMLTDRTFAANRQARRMAREGLPTADRVVSTVGGALLNPVGAVVRAPAGAGALMRGGAFVADNALQGGATAAVQSLEDVSPAGLRRAGEAGVAGGLLAVPAAAGVRAGMAGVRGASTLQRAYNAQPLDVTRHAMQDALEKMDKVNFGRVRGEATGPATKEIRAILRDPTVAPFARIVRNSRELQGANDNIIFLETYKRMSEAQRAARGKQEGSAELLAGINQLNRDIGLAKKDMLTAAEPSMPSLRPANEAHAAARGEIEAFNNVADAVQRIMGRRAQKGKNEAILFESPEALRRGIADMEPGEARAAYNAVLGRVKETAKLSSNPLTGFGVPGSVMRMGFAPQQVNPYLRLLEQQAGMKTRFFDRPVVAERAGRAGARVAGGLLNY